MVVAESLDWWSGRAEVMVVEGVGGLLCPLAVFTPRHAANLLRLKAFFARQWHQMPSAQFMAVFGPYSTRITQILERYPAPLIAAAAAEAGAAADRQIPLRPEERTT